MNLWQLFSLVNLVRDNPLFALNIMNKLVIIQWASNSTECKCEYNITHLTK